VSNVTAGLDRETVRLRLLRAVLGTATIADGVLLDAGKRFELAQRARRDAADLALPSLATKLARVRQDSVRELNVSVSLDTFPAGDPVVVQLRLTLDPLWTQPMSWFFTRYREGATCACSTVRKDGASARTGRLAELSHLRATFEYHNTSHIIMNTQMTQLTQPQVSPMRQLSSLPPHTGRHHRPLTCLILAVLVIMIGVVTSGCESMTYGAGSSDSLVQGLAEQSALKEMERLSAPIVQQLDSNPDFYFVPIQMIHFQSKPETYSAPDMSSAPKGPVMLARLQNARYWTDMLCRYCFGESIHSETRDQLNAQFEGLGDRRQQEMYSLGRDAARARDMLDALSQLGAQGGGAVSHTTVGQQMISEKETLIILTIQTGFSRPYATKVCDHAAIQTWGGIWGDFLAASSLGTGFR
jgi:hypothetical protein